MSRSTPTISRSPRGFYLRPSRDRERCRRTRAGPLSSLARGLSFVICDIEGGESALLTAGSLDDIAAIVESHEKADPGVTERLARRFAQSHHVEILDWRSPTAPTELAFLPADQLALAMDEIRGEAAQRWLVLDPRSFRSPRKCSVRYGGRAASRTPRRLGSLLWHPARRWRAFFPAYSRVCGFGVPSSPGRREDGSQDFAGGIVVAVGAVLLGLSALAEPIGIGDGGGFGWKQITGVIVGGVVIVIGLALIYVRRGEAKITQPDA